MSQIIPKVSASDLAAVADLADENIITEDELSLVGSGAQGGFAFDGSNDYLSGPSDDFGTSDFTIVFDLLWDDAPSGVEYLARKDSGNNRWILRAESTLYRLQIINNGGAASNYIWSITPSVNHRNIVVSADRSGNATLYLNGASQGTRDISGDSAVDLGSGNNDPQQLGHDSGSFDGKMFQVRYYLEAKTSEQVANIAKGHNDTDNLFLKLAPTSTNESGWTDVSGNNRSFTANGVTRIESNISKQYINNQELVSSRVGAGAGYYFGGGTEYISTSDIECNTAITACVEFSYVTQNNSLAGLLTKRASNAGGWVLDINEGYLRFIVETDVINYDAWKILEPVNGERYRVVATWDSQNSTGAVWVNGKQIKELEAGSGYSTSGTTTTIGANSQAIEVGRTTNNNSRTYTGEIYEAIVFNRALTESEVQQVSKGQRLGFADVGATGSELLTNGGFETYGGAVPDNWTKGADITIAKEITDVQEGSNAVEMTGAGGISGNSTRWFYQAAVNNGKRHRLRAKIKRTAGTGSVQVGVRYHELAIMTGSTVEAKEESGFLVNHSTTYTALGSDWYQLEVDFTASNYILDPVHLTFGSGPTTTFLLDDVELVQVGEVLALLPESAATGKWYNEGGAGSSGDGTVTGATLINERKRGVFDDLYLDNVPSSDAGLVAGEVYRDNNGHLKIVI